MLAGFAGITTVIVSGFSVGVKEGTNLFSFPWMKKYTCDECFTESHAATQETVDKDYLRLCQTDLKELDTCYDFFVSPDMGNEKFFISVKDDSKKFGDDMTWKKKFQKGKIKSYAAGENVRVQLYFDWAEKTYYSEEKLVIGSAGRIEVDELPKGLSN